MSTRAQLLVSNHHAREIVVPEVALYIANELLSKCARGRAPSEYRRVPRSVSAAEYPVSNPEYVPTVLVLSKCARGRTSTMEYP